MAGTPPHGLDDPTATQRAWLQSVLDASADAVLVIDDHGVIRFANAAAGALFDRPSVTLVGQIFGHPLTGNDPSELDLLHRDGTRMVAEMRVTPIDWEGTPAHLASLRDVTARLRTLRELEAAKAEADRRNRELEQFASTISHDLKSPLVTIRGYVSRLLRRDRVCADESTADALQRMDNAAGRMLQHIEDLLAVNRMGQAQAEPEPIDLAALVHEICEERRPDVERRGGTLAIQPDLPVIHADPLRLRRVFENLIDNALTHGCVGDQPRVTIASRSHGDELWLFVEDTGPGVPASAREHIFEMFRRLDPDKPGTGVGLALVARVAASYGGRAWVEPAPAGGARFIVALPYAAIDPARDPV